MIKQPVSILLFFALVLSLAGCGRADTELRFHMPRHGTLDNLILQDIFQQQAGLEVVSAELEHHQSGLQALATGEADIALVENSSSFETGVRAVLPVYKSVLHILLRDETAMDHSEQPLKNQSIFISDDSPAGKAFIEMAASRQELTLEDLQIVDVLEPGKTDVIIYFGPVNPRNPRWYVPGYSLYSLAFDDVERAMSSRAIGYMLPHIEPEVIPAQTYDLPGNEEEIYTLSVDTLLATRKDVSESTVYALTKTLLQQKPRFTAIAPEIFSGLTERFDPYSLNFPLHTGARRYLARDEPSALERYAETINMLVYLLFVVLTGIFGLARLHSHRKKDRIDKFYSKIMAIRMRAMNEPHAPLLFELQQLELEAFDSLISEKLAADESFRIFIELLTRAINELDVNTGSENSD
ncbi:MAG: TAXI family TRAP transporter solute-binding subunit [Halioglobus sp.]